MNFLPGRQLYQTWVHLTTLTWQIVNWDQQTGLLNLIFGTIRRDIRRRGEKSSWILVRLIPCPLLAAKTIDDPWHSAVGIALSQLWDHDITGPSLMWDCSARFQLQC